MANEPYPLEQVTNIKKKRLEEAEKILQQKKDLLVKEEQKMKQVEDERNTVKHHKEEKLTQLRHELDTGTSTLKIEQMRLYLKTVEENLKAKELKVQAQKKQLDLAIKAVEDAKQEMLKKNQEVEKMNLHKDEWMKEQKIKQEHAEASAMDEIATTMFTRKRPLE